MTPKRAACFIALVWVCSSLISFPAIAWWRAVAVDLTHDSGKHSMASSSTSNINERIHSVPDHCVFTDDIGYLVFSSTVSFYGPLSVMVFTYYRIYRAAVAQSRSLRLGIKQVVMASTGELGKGTGGGGSGSGSGGSGSAETVELLTLRIHRGGREASDSRRYAAAAALLTYQAASRHQMAIDPSSTSSTATSNNVLQIPDVSQPSTLKRQQQSIDRRHSPPEATIAALSVSSSVDVSGDGGSGRLPIAKMNLSRKLAKIAKERKAAK